MKKRKGHSSKAAGGEQRQVTGASRRVLGGAATFRAATTGSRWPSTGARGAGGGGRAAGDKAASSTPVDRPYDSEDENEGFGNWLRSTDGVAYMRLFVVANSLLVFMTVSWSHVWQVVDIVREAVGL